MRRNGGDSRKREKPGFYASKNAPIKNRMPPIHISLASRYVDFHSRLNVTRTFPSPAQSNERSCAAVYPFIFPNLVYDHELLP